MFLTADELRELTGYTLPAHQLRWLARHGWRHEVSGIGRPVVSRAYAERRRFGFQAEWPHDTTEEPWKSDGITPNDWFAANASRFLLKPDDIVAKAAAFDFDCAPRSSGIYFLIEANRIVYVGLSKCIAERVFQHTETKPFDQYSWVNGIPALFLGMVETYYIHALNPPLNVARPPIDRMLEQFLP
jgi:hypothetical protein